MGWFKKVWKKAKKVVKKVTKPITKIVKKVAGKVKELAKKVWTGVKKGVKKIGAALTKMGPLAQMALTYFTGGLWAAYGVWGAMAKGALMGYATTGSLKGALVGGAMGGIGYGVSQGATVFKGGYDGMGDAASFTDKMSAGFKAVGTSTTEGVTNMFSSASSALETGSLDSLKYLDSSGNYINQPKDVGTEVLEGAKKINTPSQAEVNSGEASYRDRMRPKIQQDLMKGAQEGGLDGTIKNAQKWGYNEEVGRKFHSDLMKGYDPSGDFSVSEYQQGVYDYAKAGNTGVEQASMTWGQDVGNYKDAAFDYTKNVTGEYDYSGYTKDSALGMYTEAAAGGTPTYVSPKAPTTKPKAPSAPTAPTAPQEGGGLLDAFQPIKSVEGLNIGANTAGQGKGYGSGAVDTYDVTKLGLTPLTQQALLAKQQMGLA